MDGRWNEPVDAVRSGEDVSIGDEDAAAELIGAVAQQSGHPRSLALVGLPSTDDARVDGGSVVAAATFRRRSRNL